MAQDKQLRRYMVQHSDGSRSGPLNAKALRSLAATGTIGRDDQIQQVGKDEWHTASSIRGLFPTETKPDDDAASKGEWLRAWCLACHRRWEVSCRKCGKMNNYFFEQDGYRCACGHQVAELNCPRCFNQIDQGTMRLSNTSLASQGREQASAKDEWEGFGPKGAVLPLVLDFGFTVVLITFVSSLVIGINHPAMPFIYGGSVGIYSMLVPMRLGFRPRSTNGAYRAITTAVLIGLVALASVATDASTAAMSIGAVVGLLGSVGVAMLLGS